MYKLLFEFVLHEFHDPFLDPFLARATVNLKEYMLPKISQLKACVCIEAPDSPVPLTGYTV